MYRVALFASLLLVLGNVAAREACEDRYRVEYDNAVQAMERSTRLASYLAGTDCRRDSRLCSDVAAELGILMQHVDDAFNRAVEDAGNGSSCMTCDPGALIALAGEADLGFRVLHDRGFWRGPTQYRTALTDRAEGYPECSLVLAYPELIEGNVPDELIGGASRRARRSMPEDTGSGIRGSPITTVTTCGVGRPAASRWSPISVGWSKASRNRARPLRPPWRGLETYRPSRPGDRKAAPGTMRAIQPAHARCGISAR